MARREEHETHLSIRMGGGSVWLAVPLILLERSPAGARGPGADPQKTGRGGWTPKDPHAPASCFTELGRQYTHGESGAAKRQTRCPWQFIGGTF